MIFSIDGRAWRTPLTGLSLTTVGQARLRRVHYRGVYHFEGINGYEFWRTKSWLPVIGLQRRHGRQWKTWMVDDPVHWYGMDRLVAALPNGRIVVAGLGLGLMLHHMAERGRFTAITVVEECADVVTLIRPTLPADDRVQIIVGDFYEHIEHERQYDGILWDLAVGVPDETLGPLMYGFAMCHRFLPGVPLVQFGLRSRKGAHEITSRDSGRAGRHRHGAVR